MKNIGFSPKTYFTRGKYSVVDYKDPEFAKFTVTNTTRCFETLDEAILYTIACNYGKCNDNQIITLIDTFLTMVTK